MIRSGGLSESILMIQPGTEVGQFDLRGFSGGIYRHVPRPPAIRCKRVALLSCMKR